MIDKVICAQSATCPEALCGGKEPHNFDERECNHCPKNLDARCIPATQYIELVSQND